MAMRTDGRGTSIKINNRIRIKELRRCEPEPDSKSESELKKETESNPDSDDSSNGFRMVPELPIFQAEVPEWTYPTNKALPDGYRNDPETLKWLGTVTWPLIGDNNSNEDKNNPVGKGRPTGCKCRKPRGAMCVKRHVAEEITKRKTELGPAFDLWKFHSSDESEDFFWDWSLREYKKLIGVLRSPAYRSRTFVAKALKAVPSISRRSEILRYYFQILVPKRLTRQTRLGWKNFDSDDDEVTSKTN